MPIEITLTEYLVVHDLHNTKNTDFRVITKSLSINSTHGSIITKLPEKIKAVRGDS